VTWRVGDFGRFKNENPKFPRFEVLAADKEKGEVDLWYSGSRRSTTIPLATFREDCVNWWNVNVVEGVPDWVYPGVRFTLESPHRSVVVTLTQIKAKYSHTDHSIDVIGQPLQFRRRRMDYCSCTIVEPGILLLIPLKTIIKYGRPITTRWDLLRNRDIIEKEGIGLVKPQAAPSMAFIAASNPPHFIFLTVSSLS